VVVPGARAAVSRGLSVVSAGEIGVRGNKLIYSTMQGKTAADGATGKRNSPFAEAFLAGMKKADMFENVFITIASDTLRLTGGEQEPYALGYFSVPNYALNTAAIAPPAAAPAVAASAAQPVPVITAAPAAASNSVRVTSATAGIIWLDGRDTGEEIKANGRTTIPYATGGVAKIGLETADGSLFVLETPVEAGRPIIAAFPALRPQDFQTTATGNGVTVAKYTGQGGSVVVPASIGGRSVTGIGENAFRECKNLAAVTIPDGITGIGEYAFAYCHSLATVTIPDGITGIGGYAFAYCHSLAAVTIPDGVTSIGAYAFHACASLAAVTIPDSVTSIGRSAFGSCDSLKTISVSSANRQYQDRDGVLFTQDGKTLCSYPAGGKTAYRIPDGVTSIGESVFSGCASLKSVTIPASVTSIGESAFWHCKSLQSVTIPNSVTAIGGGAFQGCASLATVTIPKSITRIGAYTFYGCANLATVTIPNSVTRIDVSAFAVCSRLATITIPSSVTSIGFDAFWMCESLKSITIPSSVTSIDHGAFYKCPLNQATRKDIEKRFGTRVFDVA
jgi:hypothetical protein